MKFLTATLVALVLLLAACDTGASSPSAEPLPSIGSESMPADASMSPGESMDDDADESAGASADATSATGMTCQEAFADLDLADLAEATSLDEASDVLDDTIASCGSVADWESQLSTVLPTVNLDDVEEFLDERCDENDAIDDTPICEEVDD